MAAPPPQHPIAFPPSPPPLPPPVPLSSPSPMSMPPQLPIAFPPSPPPLPSPAPISSPSPMSMPPQLPIALPPSLPPLPSAAPPPGIKGAYWPSSSPLPPSATPTSYFTHLFYAFVQVDATSFQILITPPDERLMADFTATAHAAILPAKALLSIGGAAADSQIFSNMSSSSDNRAAFIESSIRTARC